MEGIFENSFFVVLYNVVDMSYNIRMVGIGFVGFWFENGCSWENCWNFLGFCFIYVRFLS